jgi:hypothetical protein
MKTYSADQAQDIRTSCTKILRDNNLRSYDELFKVCAYEDLRGYPQQPKYGKWTYNGKEYKLVETIKQVQELMSD